MCDDPFTAWVQSLSQPQQDADDRDSNMDTDEEESWLHGSETTAQENPPVT